MNLRSREEFPSLIAYIRYISKELKSHAGEGTIRSRWNEGERDPVKLTAPPMSRSQGAKRGKTNSPWFAQSPAIPKK